MANWDRITNRGNVEDRRSMAPVVGGITLTGVALVLVFTFLTGGDLNDALNTIEEIPPTQLQPEVQGEFAGEDNYEVFASTVLGSNNQMWSAIFAQEGSLYSEPRLVLFRSATESGCGVASSASGPHYCPVDQTIYLDETFFDELTRRFGARGGDVAEAYVISHEVAHHAQNELGIMNGALGSADADTSIKIELQADCFAGLWANSVKDEDVFADGEIQEAMDAAAAVGDDRIQQQVEGVINPETWTHGSSEQRVSWFNKGFESGNLNSCNTFI